VNPIAAGGCLQIQSCPFGMRAQSARRDIVETEIWKPSRHSRSEFIRCLPKRMRIISMNGTHSGLRYQSGVEVIDKVLYAHCCYAA